MRSSTSSSDPIEEARYRRAVPAGRWGWTWVVAFATAALVLLGAEIYWRMQGHRPSVSDTVELWSYQRQRAEEAGPRAVALVGASRLQLGFDTRWFRKKFPNRPIMQLAIEGADPLPVLRDLGLRSEFNGLVICAATPKTFLAEGGEATQADWVRWHHAESTPNRRWNARIGAAIQSVAVVRLPRLNFVDIAFRVLGAHPMPVPGYLVTHPDRSRLADYDRTDIEERSARRAKRTREYYDTVEIPSPPQWIERVREQSAQAIARIQSRGGEVVFLRMPLSGEVKRINDDAFPRSAYWDLLAAESEAMTLHADDLPGADSLVCPEGSHLDASDVPRFTARVVRELQRRGAL